MNEPAQQARRPGWIIVIPVALVVGATAWFIVAMAGR